MVQVIPWWGFRRRYHCPHANLYGVYGDAISTMPGGRRLVCIMCGKALDGPVSLALMTPGKEWMIGSPGRRQT